MVTVVSNKALLTFITTTLITLFPSSYHHLTNGTKLPGHAVDNDTANPDPLPDVKTICANPTISDSSSQECQPHGAAISLEDEPHFLIPASLSPGTLAPLHFRKPNRPISDTEAFTVGLPPELRREFDEFMKSSGLVRQARQLIYEEGGLCNDEGCLYELEDGNLWKGVLGPWESMEMIYLSPADERCFENLIGVLKRGFFDVVLEAIGRHFDLDGLMVVAMDTIFLSHSESEAETMHQDLFDGKGSLYTVMIPLYIPPHGASLYMGDDTGLKPMNMHYDVGTVLGAETWHGTAPCDYRKEKDVRISMAIYLADVNEDNIDLLSGFTSSLPYPIRGDVNWFAAQWGRFWRRNGSRSLATDRGRMPLVVEDEWQDCKDLKRDGQCRNDPMGVRLECAKTCEIYLTDEIYYATLNITSPPPEEPLPPRPLTSTTLAYTMPPPPLKRQPEDMIVHSLETLAKLSPSSIPPKINSQFTWLRSFPTGYVSPKIIAATELGNGFYAAGPITKGEHLITVPAAALLGPNVEDDGHTCHTAVHLAHEREKGMESQFEPYVTYVFEDFDHKSLPVAWSERGKDVMRSLLGEEIPPYSDFATSLFSNSCVEYIPMDDLTQDELALLEVAWRIVIARSWNEVMLPVYDMVNHRNGDWHNIDQVTSAHIGEDVKVVALRDIAPGEQLYLSYNECLDTDCYGLEYSYTVPLLMNDYGFVEYYPRRFNIFEDESVIFELDETVGREEDERELEVTWITPKPSRSILNEINRQQMRLISLNATEDALLSPTSLQDLPSHERDLIEVYYHALIEAFDAVLTLDD